MELYYDLMSPEHLKIVEDRVGKTKDEFTKNLPGLFIWENENILYWSELHQFYSKKLQIYNLISIEHKKEFLSYSYDVQEKIVKNFDKRFYKESLGVDFLEKAFIWSISPEGGRYWNEINQSPSEEELIEIYKLIKFINNKSDNYKKYLKERI